MKRILAATAVAVVLLAPGAISAQEQKPDGAPAAASQTALGDMAARDTDAIDGIRAGGEDPTSPSAGKTGIDPIGSFFDQCDGVEKKNKTACVVVTGAIGIANVVFTFLP